MKIAAVVRAALILSLLSLAAACVKVQSGDVVTCKRCKKEISNTTKEMTVAFWNTGKYALKRTEGCCDACGNIQVKYKETLLCVRCKKAYSTVVKKDYLKNDPRDVEVEKGYCSKECVALGKVEETVGKASETIGDLFGRILKGLLSGLKKHTD